MPSNGVDALDFADPLQRLCDNLHVCVELVDAMPRTNECDVGKALLRYALQHVQRFSATWMSDPDAGLLATRRLHEVSLLAKWFAANPRKIQLLVLSRLDDERQVLDGFLAFATGLDAPAVRAVTERRDDLNRTKRRMIDLIDDPNVEDGGLDAKASHEQIPNFRDLAVFVDKTAIARGDSPTEVEDYGALYRLTSKLLHATGLTIFDLDAMSHVTPEIWVVLVLHAQRFARGARQGVADLLAVEFPLIN